MKQSPKLPAEKRRAQLIKAAEKIFTRKGYVRATTEEIARAAKLTKGALYFHFDSKEDIFFAVVKEVNGAFLDSLTEILHSEPDPLKAVEKSMLKSLELIDRQKYFTVEFWRQAHNIPIVRNYLFEKHTCMEKEVVGYFMSHTRLTKKEAASLFGLLHAVFDGIMVRNMFLTRELEYKNIIPTLIEMIKQYLIKNK